MGINGIFVSPTAWATLHLAIENCPFTVEFAMKIVVSLSYSILVYQRVSVVIGLLLLSGNQTQQLQIPI